MTQPEVLKKICYNDDGSLKKKEEARAGMINHLILTEEELIDINDAEDTVDKLLREWNLWNEPTLADLFKDDDEATEL